MSTIIRATDQNRGIHQVAFNFDDMAVQANRYLEQVRAQAAQILLRARQEAEALWKKAESEGRAAGQRAIEELTQKQLAEHLATLLPSLHDAIRQIQDARQTWLIHWEKQAVHVAAAIAARVIRRQLPQRPEVTLKLVREALELAAGTSHLRIHMNPADHQTLGSQVETLIKELSGLATAELVADPEISLGGCRVETRFGVIDQQLEAQLARIEEELT